MNIGQILLILHDVVEDLVHMNLLDNGGIFQRPSIQDDARIAKSVHDALEAHGIDSPDQVDKVINLLPMLIAFIK